MSIYDWKNLNKTKQANMILEICKRGITPNTFLVLISVENFSLWVKKLY